MKITVGKHDNAEPEHFVNQKQKDHTADTYHSDQETLVTLRTVTVPKQRSITSQTLHKTTIIIFNLLEFTTLNKQFTHNHPKLKEYLIII